MEKIPILVINPGSTSTKLAVYVNDEALFEKNMAHSASEIKKYHNILEQLEFRKQIVYDFLSDAEISPDKIFAVVGRGGLLKPLRGGTYLINERMCQDLECAVKQHASNLGGLLAKVIGDDLGITSFIVDPVVVDELAPVARVSGIKGIERVSIFHALNQKAGAHKMAASLGKKYDECNLIVAHLGGGISIGAHERGKVIDVNNALDGDGPFSPERSGGVPAGSLIELCFRPDMTKDKAYMNLVGKGGLVSYFGVNDAREIEKMIREGNEEARLIYHAMAYQVSKEIGACAAVLKGQVDGIVLTGGIACSKMIVDWIKENVDFIAPISVFPGENEMEALALGVLRVLNGEESPQIYQ